MFDIAVVGLGLVGGAALRHLSAGPPSVVGIGPAEPGDWSTHAGPFASHYDSGRVTRRLDARYEWAVLASRSIDEYPVIESASGLAFHHPVGLLFVRNDEAGIANQRTVISRLDLPVTVGSTDDMLGGAREFVVPRNWTVFHEPGPAGYIDPRIMLRAQLDIAARQGADIRRTFARRLRRTASGFQIECESGKPVEAANVLVTAGAYTGSLLEKSLAATVSPEAVLLARVAPEEAQRLNRMPSLIYLLDHPLFDDVYLVPPTRYPDGHHYLKMGGSYVHAAALNSNDDMHTWMTGRAANQQRAAMEGILRSLLPSVAFEAFSMKPCLITDTVHGLPFIDQLDEGLFVAAGGNGHAAKSADAIGALAADLVSTGRWNDAELDRAAFVAVVGDYRPDSGSRHGN